MEINNHKKCKRCLGCGEVVTKDNSIKIKNNMYICYECYNK